MSSKNISEFKQSIIHIRNNFIDQIINAFTDFYFGIDKSRKDLEISIIDIQTLGNKLSETIVKQVAENFNNLLKSFTKDVADLEAVYIKRLSNNEYKITELQSNIERLTQMISNLDLKNKALGTQLTEASTKILDLSEQNKKLLLVQSQSSLNQTVSSEQKPVQKEKSDLTSSSGPQEEKLEPQKLLFNNLLNKINQYETSNAQQTMQVEKLVTELTDLRKTLAVRDQEVEHYRGLVEEYRSKYTEEVTKNQDLQNQHEEQIYQPIEPKKTLAAIQNILSSKTPETLTEGETEKHQLEEKERLINELKDKLTTYEKELRDLKERDVSPIQKLPTYEKELHDLKEQNTTLSQQLTSYEKENRDLKEQNATLIQRGAETSSVSTGSASVSNISSIKEFYRKELESIPKYQILFRLEKVDTAKVDDLRKIIQYSRPAMDTLLKDLVKEEWITFTGKDNTEVKLLKKLP